MTPQTPRWVRLPAVLLAVGSVAVLAAPEAHCGNYFQAGMKAYWEGDFPTAVSQFTHLESEKDKDYVLYLCNGAMAAISAGDFVHAERLLMAAKLTSEKELTGEEVAGQVLISDDRKTYTGHAYERVLTNFLLGLCQYARGDYDRARIAFLEALEADTGSREEYERDAAYVHYMLGKTFMQMGQQDDAAVAMRNVDRFGEDKALVNLGLAQAAMREGKADEAGTLMQQYYTDDACAAPCSLDTCAGYVTVVLLNGLGPSRGADEITGAFTTIEERKYLEFGARFYVDGRPVGCSHKLTGLLEQAQTGGGMGEQFASKAAGAAARKGIAALADAIVPGASCLTQSVLGDNEADVRFWVTAPGDIQVCEVPMPPGLHTLRIEFLDAKGKVLPRYEQVWYYVRAREDVPAMLVVRSVSDIHRQRTAETVMREEMEVRFQEMAKQGGM